MGKIEAVLLYKEQGLHQGLTAWTESGSPGLRGGCRRARDLGRKALDGRGKEKGGIQEEKKKPRIKDG